MADRVEEVGLAQADASVEEDGVIDRPWRLGDGLAGRPSELVGGADHERLERVARRGIVGRGADGTLARGDGGALWLWVDLDRDARVPAEYRAGGGPNRVDVMVCAQSRVKGLGAPTWRWSPSKLVSRQGRSHDARAGSGTCPSRAASRRAHSALSTHAHRLWPPSVRRRSHEMLCEKRSRELRAHADATNHRRCAAPPCQWHVSTRDGRAHAGGDHEPRVNGGQRDGPLAIHGQAVTYVCCVAPSSSSANLWRGSDRGTRPTWMVDARTAAGVRFRAAQA